MGQNPPCEPSAGWWVLTTANAAETNDLTCFSKHGRARDNKFLVTHPITDQRCLTSTIARRSALTAAIELLKLHYYLAENVSKAVIESNYNIIFIQLLAFMKENFITFLCKNEN
jgi:thymidine kinase